MPLIPLQIPKGIYKNGTDFMAQGRWHDANLIRWHEDALRPVGGWLQRGSVDLSMTVRGSMSWRTNDGSRYAAFGSYDTLKVMTASNVVYDIAPTDIDVGILDETGGGFGLGNYGAEYYGLARDDIGVISRATTWSLDNWGEYLVACSSKDGRLLEWQLNTASDAAVVSNAPIDNTAIVVTEERFVFCLGAGGNPRKVQWSDQEDNTTWTAAATNQAGDLELQTRGAILAGIRGRGQTVILTDQDCHAATYQGPPFVYGIERVGTSCGLIAANAAVSVDTGVIWMGRRGFYVYQGGAVQSIPCEVGDHVFSDMNTQQTSKISAVVNSKWNEIWWFYPSSSSMECDSYVVYDYVENIWSIGEIDRTSGFDDGIFRKPMWVDASGVLYEHETGNDYGSQTPFAETGPILIGAGDQAMRVTNLIPDEKTQGDVTAKFKTRFYPNGDEREYGPFTMSNPTSVRFQGRQVRMRVEGNQPADWRVGIMRLQANAGGTR